MSYQETEINQPVRDHIFSYLSKGELRLAIEGLRAGNTPDFNVAKDLILSGMFLEHYLEVAQFLEEIGVEAEEKHFGDLEAWDKYINLVAREIKRILQ